MPTWIDDFFPHRTLLQGDRRLLHLFVGRVLSSTGFSITIPFLGLYLHVTRGFPMSAVGLMFALAALTGAVGQILGGEWSDRFGRRPVLVIAQAGRAAIFVVMGVAVLLQRPFVDFVLLTCASAFFGRLYEPPSAAMIADLSRGERRAEAFGILRVAGNLGFAVGPVIGGFLATISYSTLFFVSAGILAFSSALLWLRVGESLPRDRRRAAEAGIGDDLPRGAMHARGRRAGGGIDLRSVVATLHDPRFLRHMIACLFFFTVLGQLMATFSVYAVEWAGLSKVELGWVYSLNGAMVTLLQFPAVRMLAPYRMTTALVLGSVLMSAGYGIMGFVRGFGALALSMGVVTLGEITATPAAMNLSANFSTEETRGRTMGVYGLFSSLGWSIGPLVGGALLDAAHGVAWIPWSGVALLGLIGAAGFFELRGRLTTAMDQSEETAAPHDAVATPEGDPA